MHVTVCQTNSGIVIASEAAIGLWLIIVLNGILINS